MNRNEDIEKYIRQEFEKSIDNKEDWTNPSDYLFLSAMNKVNHKDRKPNRFIFLLVGFFIVTLGALTYYNTGISKSILDLELANNIVEETMPNKNQFTSRKPKMSQEIPNEIIKPDLNINSSSILTNKNLNKLSNKELKNLTEIEKSKELNNSSNSRSLKETKKAIDYNIESTKKSQISNLSNIHVTENATFDFNNNISDNSLIESRNIIHSIEPLFLLNNKLAIKHQQIKNKKLPSLSEEDTSLAIAEEPKISAYITIGTKLNTITMTDVSYNNELYGYNRFRLGLLFGGGINYTLSEKFSLYSNVYYSKFSNRSWYKNEMDFSTLPVVIDQEGTAFYEAEMNLESPMGVTNFDETMEREVIDVVDESILNYDVNFEHKFSSIDFEFGLTYDLISKEKFSFSVNAGANIIRFIDFEENYNVGFYNDDSLVVSTDNSHSQMSSLNNWIFRTQTGASLRYKISKNMFAVFNSSYVHSFNTLNKYDEFGKSNLKSINLTLSTGYMF